MIQDNAVPGGVYLCQISETISCGACCGLYNIADLSFDHLSAMLLYRTERFARVPRTMDAILAFKAHIEEKEKLSLYRADRRKINQARLFASSSGCRK